MSEKLLEFPDLKTQEQGGGGKDQTDIFCVVSLWATMEGLIACRSNRGNLSTPPFFKKSPPDICSSDIPPTRES